MPSEDSVGQKAKRESQAVIMLALASGANTLSSIARETGKPANSVRRHLMRLVASGVVVKTVNSKAGPIPDTYALAEASE